jgi:asparagine synthase (glutamine-hydrolysing)
MVADVPLGAFLSGGIDSSLVVALMQAQSERPVETFAIGFDEASADESGFARAVARHLGTNHHERTVTGQDALDVVPELASMYDEPFADPSQIPTHLLSRFTRGRVTVSLSGDAGDELFAGYDRYAKALALWGRLKHVPGPARSALSLLGRDGAAALLRRGLALAPGPLAARVLTAVELGASRDFRALYRSLVSHWREDVVLGAEEPETPFSRAPGPRGPLEEAMLLDWLTYLPDDILVKVDRAAMAVSLETRVPLLDPRVIELAWRLPGGFKLRAGSGKWVLRQVLDRYVPRALVDRPKHGFTAPIGRWIERELRAWATDLLSGERLRREGFLDAALVEEKLREHLSGRRDWGWPLWSVLVFESWLEHQRARPPAIHPMPARTQPPAAARADAFSSRSARSG